MSQDNSDQAKNLLSRQSQEQRKANPAKSARRLKPALAHSRQAKANPAKPARRAKAQR